MTILKLAYVAAPVEFGGAERVSLSFLKSFDRRRFEVCPILLVRPWEPENVFLQELKAIGLAYRTIPVAKRPLREGRDLLRVPRSGVLLFSILWRNGFDIVHTVGYFADIIGTPVARALGIRQVSTCHGFISNNTKLKFYNRVDLLMLRFPERIIAVSEEMKTFLMRKGIDPGRIVVVQNAVSCKQDEGRIAKDRARVREAYRIAPEEVVLGYVGRLSEEKGLRYLIEAGSRLKEAGIPVRILVVGDGEERSAIESMAHRLGIGDRVIMTGFQRDVEPFLGAMDIFVLPSLTEGTPMALLEAMANGIPVVATGVGGVPGVVRSGTDGLLVRPGDSGEIEQAVRLLCADSALRSSLARTGRETVFDRFGFEEWVRKVESVYESVGRPEGRSDNQ